MNVLRFFTKCLCFANAVILLSAIPAFAATPAVEPVSPNDNTLKAGVFHDDVLTLRLRAAAGAWQPEGPDGAVLQVEAFGEEGAGLSVPAPLLRVAEGMTVVASVRNELSAPLRVNGLCARDGSACAPLDVPAGATREVTFAASRPGTYHYWATTMGAPIPFRELAGAFVVDPAGGAADRDRIFVITEWTSLTPAQVREIMTADEPSERFLAAQPKLTFVMNGLSWPATERLTYRQGDPVRWRVINLSSQTHPMHLHGFYFTVTHLGDGRRDAPVGGTEGRRVVTQMLPSGGTLAMQWVPERPGNWLFHCHVMHHVAPERRLSAPDPHAGHAGHGSHHGAPDASLGMAGMVLGITVTPRADTPTTPPVPGVTPRRLTMEIHAPSADGSAPAGFTVTEADGPEPADTHIPSPDLTPLVLRRGEPVEITLVNRLAEPTSMHWHGLELDSVYDGVHGWSGEGRQLAPMIEPGGSFVVRITPPRTGTFIYHTHLHDYRQLTSGLYGPLVVVDPDAPYDATTDHVVVLGRRNATAAASILKDPESAVLNGVHAPRWAWKAGTRHRLRLINITPDDIWSVSLVGADGPVTWRPLTKDGAPVASTDAQPGPARVTIAVGETYDFEFEAPQGRKALFLEARGIDGIWQAQGRVLVK